MTMRTKGGEGTALGWEEVDEMGTDASWSGVIAIDGDGRVSRVIPAGA